MTLTPRRVSPASAALLIFFACGERASGGAERPPARDTIAASAQSPGPAANVAAQDSAGWLQVAMALREPRPGARPAVLSSVEASAHEGYDRVTFTFSTSGVPGYHVEYTTEPVRECGSGSDVNVAGTGRLVVRLEPAQAHDDQGRVTVQDRERATALPTVEQMKLICDFEGQVQWVLGVTSPAPYRVIELTAPPRLVVDVRYQP